jgi:hypothetical protein
MQKKRDSINLAISTKSNVWIKYRDYHGNVTEREITPLRWTRSDRFQAFCHLRQDERYFRIERIIQFQVLGSPNGSTALLPRQAREKNDVESETPLHPAVRKVARKQTSKDTRKVSKQQFTRVETRDQWSRLVKYYTKCLLLENRQQYIIENESAFRFFPADPRQIYEFLTGRVVLDFQMDPSADFARFVNSGQDRQGQQLCLGYPVFVISREQLAPLIVSSVTVEKEKSQALFSLRADEPTPSYAALSAFGLKDEEIEALLAECDDVKPQQGQSIVEAWEGFLVSRLSEFLGCWLDKRSWDGRGSVPTELDTLLSVPCLFWVKDNIATANLIKELGLLSDPGKWALAPIALRRLLDKVPEHDYPQAVPLADDNSIYVTEVNEEQRQAIAAMRNQDVTVVTGPPGTGKSQMVLNIVAHAVMNGQSVLFASRNNEAVNVVMNRLGEELGFPGAIRTGNQQYRASAAKDMLEALSRVAAVGTHPPAASLREKYLDLKHQLQSTEKTLHQVRETEGLLESYCTERDDLVALLPKPVVKAGESYTPPFSREEIDHLQATISTLITSALRIKNTAMQLGDEVLSLVTENELQSPLIVALEAFEKQWGAFGGRFLHPDCFDTLEKLQTYAQTWLVLLPALDAQGRVTQLAQQYREASSSCLQHQESLSPELLERIETVVSKVETQKLLSLVKKARQISTRAEAISAGKLPFLERLLAFLGLIQPVKKTAEQFVLIKNALGLNWNFYSSQHSPGLADLAKACHQLAIFTVTCWLQSRMNDLHRALESERQGLDEVLQPLPPSLAEDVRKIDLPDTDSSALTERMESILARIDELIKRRDQLAERVNAKLDGNDDALKTLESFKSTPAGKDKLLWTLRIPVRLEIIISHLTKWRNLVAFWEINEAIRGLQGHLETLLSESELVESANKLKHKQGTLSAKIMESRWLEHAKDLDTSTLQKAHRYASAVQQLSLPGPYDRSTYGGLRASVEENLPAALEVFPIWATTNLSAKTNLPLMPGLFDVVVIDEASQCDIPSALPLLYRAKRAVIIGDPNQLRHVATLYEDSDIEAAAQFGIAPDAFLYNTHSLFDIAERSVGARPGTLWLTEHYRSHAQIIGFSNEEFYDNKLIVRTDLLLRGIPQSFLDIGCGVFWLDVDGTARHPPKGSAFNSDELKVLQELLPSIVDAVRRHEKPSRQDGYVFSIGIVTPYRQQANEIRRWVSQTYGNSGRIVVGTAHTFQGNERDIIIFSSVLAPGLSEGSLNWLDRTDNLLNVAITRARSQLIVLGHWDYCHNLPLSSKYRRLADYIGKHLDHLLREVGELPILGGEPVDVIGTLTGDEYNRTTLLRFVRYCKEFVWWVDPYLQNHVFDLFWDVFQHPGVDIRDVRLLTSIEQTKTNQSNRPQLSIDKAQALQNELRSRGVSFQLRLLPKKVLPHDRFFYSVGESVKMPPFGGAYGDHKHVSEYTRSKTEPAFFEKYWDKAEDA